MMSTTRMAMSHRELPLFLRLLNIHQNGWLLKMIHACVCIYKRVCVFYLKDSCPGVSMISMPGIFKFSLSNCTNTNT